MEELKKTPKPKKKPRELLNEFIDKNLQKEKDKFMEGRKHNLYGWEELRDEVVGSAKAIQNLNEEIAVYQQFIKEMGYTTAFRQWANSK